MKGRKIVSTLLALLLLVSMPMSALAATWDISKGDITVNAGSGGQTVTQGGGAAVEDNAPVIKGSSKENTVTINAEKDQTASVTLSGASIDVRDKGKAAVSTTGEGNVSIELNGESTLRSGYEHAGLEKNNGGSLTIAAEDKNGKLTAWGGQQGAGIGGGSGKDGSNIFITGGGVNAIGGLAAAGIGGGEGGGISGLHALQSLGKAPEQQGEDDAGVASGTLKQSGGGDGGCLPHRGGSGLAQRLGSGGDGHGHIGARVTVRHGEYIKIVDCLLLGRDSGGPVQDHLLEKRTGDFFTHSSAVLLTGSWNLRTHPQRGPPHRCSYSLRLSLIHI